MEEIASCSRFKYNRRRLSITYSVSPYLPAKKLRFPKESGELRDTFLTCSHIDFTLS